MVNNNYTMIKEIREYAKENKVPIMQLEGIDFLTTFIIKHQIKNVLEKIFAEKLMVNDVKTRKLNKLGKRAFCYMSEDKFLLQIGQASKVKNGSPVSGDSCLQIRLSDGKYLLAISDGMGSGPEARKSSQIAIKMLERLLMSGFDKNTSIDLINTTIMNANEEIFATLDIIIIDLFNGKLEFIKNGACPTYVKNGKNVQIVKSLSLPAGILKNINLTTYDFQAPDFYKKCGYEVEFVRKNKEEPKLTKYFLVKYFND